MLRLSIVKCQKVAISTCEAILINMWKNIDNHIINKI